MGRRFPEFCTLRAVCLVNVKVSSSATGDARVASYQAAINSVAAQYYADWPLMVEVLNKWLEMNEDFVRDPHGCFSSNSLTPSPPRAIHDQALTPTTLTSDHAQIPPTIVEDVSLPPSIPLSSPGNSTSGIEPDNPDYSSSSNNRRDVHFLVYKFFPSSWTGPFRFFPAFWTLGIRPFSSAVRSGLSGMWLIPQKPSAQHVLSAFKTRWFNLSFPCKRWWDILKVPFVLRSGRCSKQKDDTY